MDVVCPVCETDEDFFVIEERETFSVFFFCNNCEKEVIIRSYPKHTSSESDIGDSGVDFDELELPASVVCAECQKNQVES